MLYKMKNMEDMSSEVKLKSRALFIASMAGTARGSMFVGVSRVNSDNKASNANSCPDCGGYLARIGYCFSCVACGWGECS
ncbi:MAG: hypothetical protein ABIE07_08375 [Candidatus Zixiibacteriota bacterium]